MQQDEMKSLIDNFIKFYNSFDIDAMLLHMHEDISFRNISNGQVSQSPAGFESPNFLDKISINHHPPS